MFWFRRIQKEDPVFGKMLYMGDKASYWEGTAHLPAADRRVEIFAHDDSQGEMANQHAIFRTIVDRWPELESVVVMKIQSESKSERNESFHVSSLSIPNCRSFDDAEWEVSFTAEPSGDSYTVQMKGAFPTHVVWDT